MLDDHEWGPKGRERLLERLDKLVESGRVTPAEAAGLRAARGSDEFDSVVRAIRVRHAGTHLGAAVEGGQMTQEEADGHLERLKSGAHPRSLRAHLRRLRPAR